MLIVNACCYTYLYIGSAKVQQNSNFTKRKSDFFSSTLTLFLLYSYFIPGSRTPVYFFGTKVSQV